MTTSLEHTAALLCKAVAGVALDDRITAKISHIMSRGSTDGTTVKMDFMSKRSQMKSRFTLENYKSRWFVLTTKILRYHDGTEGGSPCREKGRVYLSTMTAIEEVEDSALGKSFVFQIVYKDNVLNETRTLYVIAKHADQREEWIQLLRKESLKCHAIFTAKYHPGVWQIRERRYTCCQHISKESEGCKNASVKCEKPIPRPGVGIERQLSNISKEEEETVIRRVIAIFDYECSQEGDLSLTKGEEYDVLNDTQSGPHWWLARNKRNEVGFIPANYVQQLTEHGLEKFDWYYPNITRSDAESILRRESKEGCFLLRESSQQGKFSLSLFSKDLNPQGVVRHYHIKQDDRGHYYFSDKHDFPTIPELINYHKYNSAGLVVRLRSAPSNLAREQPATVGLGHEIVMYADPYAQDIWEIEWSELKQGEELGKGQFGAVYKARWRNQTDVAIKVMQEGTMHEEDFLDEAKTMKHLQHPNVVQLYGVCSSPICLVMEYMCHGALLFFLRKYREKLFAMPGTMLDMSLQVCRGMKYLESKSFIHRDLAARNCLVGDNNRVKVCDFGLTRFVLDDDYTSSAGAKFPIKWAPPEVLGYCRFSSKSDVWAFGVLMWEIFSGGEMPYGRAKNHEVVTKVVNDKERLEKPPRCPADVYGIMHSCWESAPEDRPTFDQLYGNLDRLQEDGVYPR